MYYDSRLIHDVPEYLGATACIVEQRSSSVLRNGANELTRHVQRMRTMPYVAPALRSRHPGTSATAMRCWLTQKIFPVRGPLSFDANPAVANHLHRRRPTETSRAAAQW